MLRRPTAQLTLIIMSVVIDRMISIAIIIISNVMKSMFIMTTILIISTCFPPRRETGARPPQAPPSPSRTPPVTWHWWWYDHLDDLDYGGYGDRTLQTLDYLTFFLASRASRAFGQLLASLLIRLYLEWIHDPWSGYRYGPWNGWFDVKVQNVPINEVYVQRQKYPSTGWRTSEL